MPLDQEFLNISCCPKRKCRGRLGEISHQGASKLKCTSCDAEYDVVSGIPILFPNIEFSSEAHKRHWDLAENALGYSKKYDGYMKKEGTPWGMYTHVSELRAVQKLTSGIDLTDKIILDAGCGNGRLLAAYPETKRKIGIDASLLLLQKTKERDPNLWLVCGQLEDLPFKGAVADFSISIRVYQHLLAPEDAFSEMTRGTKPTGHVALELYNRFNLKEIYRRFRMLKWVDKIRPWGLSYDAYFSYLDIEKWCRQTFVFPLKYSGAGWGIHFYLLDSLFFRKWAPKSVQTAV